MNIRYNEDGTVDFLERNDMQEDAYENGGLSELFFDDCEEIQLEAFYADQAWDMLLETLNQLQIVPTDTSTAHLIHNLQFDILMSTDITTLDDAQLEQWKQQLFILLETSHDTEHGGEDGIADQGGVGNNEHEEAYRRAMSIIS